MTTYSFRKTLLALIISGACASTLGADLSVNGNTNSGAQNSTRVQNHQVAASANHQNSTGVQASVDENAPSKIRAQTTNSVQSVSSLGSTVKDEAEDQARSVAGSLSAHVESHAGGGLSISTLDGIAIDLSGSSENSVAAQLNSSLNTTLMQSAEAVANVRDAAVDTGIAVLGNTAASIAEAGSALDISAAAESSSAAASNVQFDDAAIGAVESAAGANTSSSLVGGLL